MSEQEAVLRFWFPKGAGADIETHKEYCMWRMRGGADAAIIEQFSELTECAALGEFDPRTQLTVPHGE